MCGALEEHVRRFFAGRTIDVLTWPAGPIHEQNPHFRVLRVAPATTADVWTYVSVGGWADADGDSGLEFVLSTATAEDRAVELLAMIVFYNRGGKLSIGHTQPIGEPWLPGSGCDHLLVCRPYPYGPDLQTSHVGDRHVEFLWLLPITMAERDLVAASGLEALESQFDEVGLNYWQVDRPSVI
ncbi:Suppressor of fused protein (SUFU) [Knoellia sinensis KCTC 19936]|uniref:Suppressor of fused protein (SUFU) n=1 Tax=Knoellia sinensis KCTC 19936 TaxID=1385520 RepID=A0A0A0J405_9MICO|nr:Suppressor of fused protein (SUFU) [Knoellia sinensis KCTC 19936]